MDFTIERIQYRDEKKVQTISEALAFLRSEYPGFNLWYRKKVRKELKSGMRQIYVAVPRADSTQIAGILILKNKPDEKKICTLCVFPAYQGQHIGTEFLQLASEILHDPRPLISVSNTHVKEFEPLFRKFGFTLYQTYPNYYRNGFAEYSFNAPIEQNFIGYIANG